MKSKLNNPAVSGAPEDQLRAPLETLFHDITALIGPVTKDAVLVGESSLADLKTRPDYAVTRQGALIGFVEVKAPGKGADPRGFSDAHDKAQWEKLKSLPNLIYTDGAAFSLWRDGKREGAIIRLDGDLYESGAALTAPDELVALFTDFFQWDPIPPRNPRELAETSARLCRLLRDEVEEQLHQGAKGLTDLKVDWRKLLFPSATDEQFADGYAQAVTFGLLMAKARGLDLADGLESVAKDLRKSNSLIGSALRLLTDEAENEATLKTSLATLTRVLNVVDWAKIGKGNAEAWLYFYEDFLSVYDNDLRKKTGSYYTPPEIVTHMVRLVDEALRSPDRFGLVGGLASPDVTVADPAVGTGTFLLGVLRRIAETAEADGGAGTVPGVINAALKRLIGFELQFGPFAVAQLRLLAEISDLTDEHTADAAEAPLRLYVADTLADPEEEISDVISLVRPISESRKAANAIKRQEPITVVIGNPPYKEKANGLGGWVENGRDGLHAPLQTWQPPASWGVGAHAKHLRNLYVYFWRWATWKVFGDLEVTREVPPQTPETGVICFITVAGYLNGPGFQKMRADLRRDADEIWVIDCSPEGHQPAVSSRVFQGVQQPVCIVLASRTTDNDPTQPARVRFRALPRGTRAEKFKAFATIGLDDDGWVDAADGWRASFLPEATALWGSFPNLDELFLYDGSGVMPGRTWVIAPDTQSLRDRWARLIQEKDAEKKAMLFHPHLRDGKPGDKHVNKLVQEGLSGHPHRALPVAKDALDIVEPARYGFRSFDRQWIVPDSRLLNQSNPTLWSVYSPKQIFITALMQHSPTAGPAISITGLIPDLHHYKGSFGGRVFPLWGSADAAQPNLRPALLAELSAQFGRVVTAEDLFAYIAAVAAHPGYVAQFTDYLTQPGLRIPLAADAELFAEAAALGREVIWLHTFGDRFAEGRPPGPPRVAQDGPTIPKGGAIPSSAEAMPETIDYDPAERRLKIGTGYIDNVAPEVWAYEVSGKPVLRQWFSYRGKDRSRPIIGDRRPPSPLGDIQPEGWLAEYTAELLNVLHVLTRLVALEPEQAKLLKQIVEGPIIDAETLRASGALPPAEI